MSDTARYSCSASSTRAKPCGSVRADNANISSAEFLMLASSPSAPPMMNAVSPPFLIQPPMDSASLTVVHCRPLSSIATVRHLGGSAARIRAPSAVSSCSTFLPPPRFSGLIYSNSILASRGMRLAYSTKLVSTHPGILLPTAKMRNLMVKITWAAWIWLFWWWQPV